MLKLNENIEIYLNSTIHIDWVYFNFLCAKKTFCPVITLVFYFIILFIYSCFTMQTMIVLHATVPSEFVEMFRFASFVISISHLIVLWSFSHGLCFVFFELRTCKSGIMVKARSPKKKLQWTLHWHCHLKFKSIQSTLSRAPRNAFHQWKIKK